MTPGSGATGPSAVAVELGTDRRFARRIVRLTLVSAIMLGVVFRLATVTLHPAGWIAAGLAGGWLLMPVLLALSLRWPRLRYALILPSSLVSLSLLALFVTSPFPDALTHVGWSLLTTGVLLGGLLGMWFWFRWLPVPRPLHDPFSTARWTLIGAHVALIVAGIGLVLVRAG